MKLKPYSSTYHYTEQNERECHEIRHDKWASKIFLPSVGERVRSNPDMFMPEVTDYLSDILCWSLYLPWGP